MLGNFGSWFRKRMKKSMFQEPRIAMIFLLDIAFILIGTLLCIYSHPISGAILMLIGGTLIIVGFKNIDVSKNQAGVLTTFGAMITDDHDHTTCVEGYVFLLPPFLDVIVFDMSYAEFTFDIDVMTVEPQVGPDDQHVNQFLKGKATGTMKPDPRDMKDYNVAGKKDKIKDELATIVDRDVQNIITLTKDPRFLHLPNYTGLSAITICQNSKLISDQFEIMLNGKDHNINGQIHHEKGILETKDFGMRCVKFQVNFPLPQKITDAMTETATINFRAVARTLEFKNDIEAIQLFQTALNLSSKEAADLARQWRLIRDGKMTEELRVIEGRGNPIGNIIFGANPLGQSSRPNRQNRRGRGGNNPNQGNP